MLVCNNGKSQLNIIINNSELHSYKPTQCKRDIHPQSKRQFEQKTSAFLQYQGIGYNKSPQEIKDKTKLETFRRHFEKHLDEEDLLLYRKFPGRVRSLVLKNKYWRLRQLDVSKKKISSNKKAPDPHRLYTLDLNLKPSE